MGKQAQAGWIDPVKDWLTVNIRTSIDVPAAIERNEATRIRIPPADISHREHPGIAGSIARDSGDDVGRQSVWKGVCPKNAVAVLRDAAAIGTCPEPAIAPAEHPAKAIAPDALGVAPVVSRKPHTIKADQAVERGDPEVTLWGLADASSAVEGKAVVRGPVVSGYLGVRKRR